MKRRDFLGYSAKMLLATGASIAPFGLNASDTPTTGLVFDDSFKHHHIDPHHPESPARFYALQTQFIKNQIFIKTSKVPLLDKKIEPYLALVHTKQHIQAIKKSDLQTHEHVCRATSGVLAAVKQVCTGQIRNAFCAGRPPGHHALNTGKEEGFCSYNHIAIAARYAQQSFGLKKILIVDWDYHHGNGTEATFYDDPDVLFFSTHDQYAYPGTGHPARRGKGLGLGFNINVHLDCGANDEAILQAFHEQLLPAANAFQPELILVSCGFDSRENDLLGCHNVTDAGFARLTTLVQSIADQHCGGRLVSVLEGGYNVQGNAKAAVSHLEALCKSQTEINFSS